MNIFYSSLRRGYLSNVKSHINLLVYEIAIWFLNILVSVAAWEVRLTSAGLLDQVYLGTKGSSHWLPGLLYLRFGFVKPVLLCEKWEGDVLPGCSPTCYCYWMCNELPAPQADTIHHHHGGWLFFEFCLFLCYSRKGFCYFCLLIWLITKCFSCVKSSQENKNVNKLLSYI